MQHDTEMINAAVMHARVYAAHEHIGSLVSFGQAAGICFPSDVTPAHKPGRTTLLTLLFTPYAAPVLCAEGAVVPPPEAFTDDAAFLRAMDGLRPVLARTAGLGVLVALDRGLKHLYGSGLYHALDDATGARLLSLNAAIAAKYDDYFRWSASVMEQTQTVRVLKPVHPEYLLRAAQGEGAAELAYTIPVARVDGLIGVYDDAQVLRFDVVERAAGLAVTDAESLDALIAWFFGMIDRLNVCAIKQLQAYTRTLAVADVPREELARALRAVLAARGTGAPGRCRAEALIVQNYIQRRILEQADARALPYQIHTGMTTLRDAHPGLLEPLIRAYKNVRFVVLHAYPFLAEAAYLARVYPNVWLDTSWLALQSPEILRRALTEYIGMAPATRVTTSIDATCLEEYAGGLAVTRSVLNDVLAGKVARGFLTVKEACEMGARILGGNTAAVYRI